MVGVPFGQILDGVERARRVEDIDGSLAELEPTEAVGDDGDVSPGLFEHQRGGQASDASTAPTRKYGRRRPRRDQVRSER